MRPISTLMLVAATSFTASAANAQAQTLQSEFDAASADAASGNCRAAIPKFEALEKNPRVKPGSLPAAAIAIRKGECLVRVGHANEGEIAIQAGLPVIEKAGGDFNGDAYAGRIALGDAAMTRWAYMDAAEAYRTALALQKGEQRLPALAKLAKASAFNGGSAALDYANEGIQLLSAKPKPDKDSLAAFHTLHARILLNQGQSQPAYTELKKALALSGGLTEQTTLSEVSLRSDLAMAAMQVGRKDDARMYLAYTGAGRIEKSPFAVAASMDPPVCGEDTGLRPDDVAVVEFGLADNGSVTSAQTVYSRGGPSVAAAFSKAVSEWYWRPEDLAAIPLFYRVLTRVELRCSNVLGEAPGVGGPLRHRFMEWAKGHLPALAGTAPSLADDLPAIRKRAEENASPGDLVARIAALAWLAASEPSSSEKRVAMADEALALTGKAAVPPEVVNWIRTARLTAALSDRRLDDRSRLQFLALSDDPAIAKDALAADTLRLIAAAGRLAVEPDLLMKVAQDNRLPEHHPLRQLAWLQLANKAAMASDLARAQAYFANTGLTEQQCALLGASPALRRTGAGGDDYPMEALRMGFEGWVRLEFDITTDGKATHARPIVAYPPLVFVDAATAMTKGFRYEASYRPDSAMACSASRQTIRFIIPQNH